MCSSDLDRIIGIGEIKRTKLLKEFGSVEALIEASDAALEAAGLDAKTITALRSALQ